VRVIRGSVLETRYRVDGEANKLVQTEVMLAREGDVTYIDDSMGLHKVGNPSAAVGACTLHLYSPPFRQCSIWLDASRADKARAVSRLYRSP
jgi:cysteine dioxygenase